MSHEFPFKSAPRRWFLLPLTAGLVLMAFSLLVWFFPRVLLFLLLLPLFLAGLGLVLFGLDLWRGVPDWRDRVWHLRARVWPGDR